MTQHFDYWPGTRPVYTQFSLPACFFWGGVGGVGWGGGGGGKGGVEGGGV